MVFQLFLITSEVGHICTNLLIVCFTSSVKWVSMLFVHIFINLHGGFFLLGTQIHIHTSTHIHTQSNILLCSN